VIGGLAAIVVALAVDPPPRYASVTVEADVAGETREVLERRIQERGDVALRSAAVLPARDTNDATIAVVVREDAEESSYAFEIRTLRAGIPVDEPIVGTCRLCTEGEVVTAIEGRLADVIEAMDSPPAPARVSAPRPTPMATTDSARRSPLGKKGIAGVTLLVGGVATLATGIGLVLAPDRDAADPRYDVTTRPVGWALLGSGAAVATAGAVLLALDRRSARRRNRAAFSIGSGHVVVGLHGRF
jgi:hypothetical protein